ncbi:hypothetical protein ACN47E_004746 [Coniothyrium glycines]
MTTTSRSLQSSWNTAWQTAPPAACSTLRNLNNAVAWGQTCVFGEEDGDVLPFSINTACMPWVTSNIYPSPSAFYSPATACPESWTAVATQTSGSVQWLDGETALNCCPNGFESDGGTGCRQGNSGTWPVVECGEADAEENNLRTYTGGAWPAAATPSITALQLRYQGSDIGSASATSSSPSSTGSSTGNNVSGSGLSAGAIAAIATVIPLALIIGALAAFFLYRRRRNRKLAATHANQSPTEKSSRPPSSSENAYAYHSLASSKDAGHASTPATTTNSNPAAAAAAAAAPAAPLTAAAHRPDYHAPAHETPEWNAELDSLEPERQRLVSSTASPPSTPAPTASAAPQHSNASELGGLARVPRKPIAPVEIDSTPVIPEVGDAYIAYRVGGGRTGGEEEAEEGGGRTGADGRAVAEIGDGYVPYRVGAMEARRGVA